MTLIFSPSFTDFSPVLFNHCLAPSLEDIASQIHESVGCTLNSQGTTKPPFTISERLLLPVTSQVIFPPCCRKCRATLENSRGTSPTMTSSRIVPTAYLSWSSKAVALSSGTMQQCTYHAKCKAIPKAVYMYTQQ